MDLKTFDALTTRLGTARVTRMTALRGLLGGALAGGTRAARADVAIAQDFTGCPASYWMESEHFDSWPSTGYSPQDTLESVFDVPNQFGLDAMTLVDALGFKGGKGVAGAARSLLRAGVAALLNAAHLDVDYPLIVSSVINRVDGALASNDRKTMANAAKQLNKDNNQHCPLT